MSRLVLCDGKTATYRLYIDGVPSICKTFSRKLFADELEFFRLEPVKFLQSIGVIPEDQLKGIA